MNTRYLLACAVLVTAWGCATPDDGNDGEINRIGFRSVISSQVDIENVDEAERLAHSVCTQLDNGHSLGSIHTGLALTAVQEGWSDQDVTAIGTVIGGGVAAFCPQHTWQFERESELLQGS